MKTILLIEDNHDIRENTCEMLELAGYHIISAPNGQEGLALAKSKSPDLILSDIMMPLMNGHEVFEALKKDETTKKIPFIFISSSVDKKFVQSCLDSGASAYIRKPFEEKELLDTIKACLSSI